jgi:hypothetical protein
VHSSALVVRARIGSRWLPNVVEAVCVEPHSYMVRLVDGRRFRHTRWAINLEYLSSSLSAPSPGLQFSFLSVGVLPNRNDLPVGPTHSGPVQLLPAPPPATPVPPLSDVAAPSQVTADSLIRPATPVCPSSRRDPVCLVPYWQAASSRLPCLLVLAIFASGSSVVFLILVAFVLFRLGLWFMSM